MFASFWISSIIYIVSSVGSLVVAPTANTVDSCATIRLHNSTTEVRLFENTAMNRSTFETVRVNKMGGALFAVGINSSVSIDSTLCMLEICGFSGDPFGGAHRDGSCEWYSETKSQFIVAPDSIYQDNDYHVTSMGCSCQTVGTENRHRKCQLGTCINKNLSISWQDEQCAIMYQEEHCQSCYFTPITLQNDTQFLSRNSYQIKTMIVRPNCKVQKMTRGILWWTGFDDIVKTFVEVVNDTQPAFHEASENFTCVCSPSDGKSEFDPIPDTDAPGSLTITHISIIAAVGGVIIIAGAVLIFIRIRQRSVIKKRDDNAKDASSSVISGNDDILSEEFFSKESGKITTTERSLRRITVQYLEELEAESHKQADGQFTDAQGKIEALEDKITQMYEFFIRKLELQYDKVSFVNGESSSSCSPVSSSTLDNDNEFSILMDAFNQICSVEHVISRNEFSIPEVSIQVPLGNGKFSVVYKGVLKQEDVAVKKLNWQDRKWRKIGEQSFLQEIQIMEHFGTGCANVVNYLGACCNSDGLYIITEYCKQGSLQNYLKTIIRPRILHQKNSDSVNETTVPVGVCLDYLAIVRDKNQANETTPTLTTSDLEQLVHWCEQIAGAMEYLGEKGIIHVDLAVRNILLSENLDIKLCDFGLSKICAMKKDYAYLYLMGSFPFNSLAPEIDIEERSQKIYLNIDIWAFACTVWEMFTLGDSLYPNIKANNVGEFLEEVRTQLKKGFPGYCQPKPDLAPDFVYDKLLECWSDVPQNRPGFTELRKFFNMKRTEMSTHL